jgi:hypothetical protein
MGCIYGSSTVTGQPKGKSIEMYNIDPLAGPVWSSRVSAVVRLPWVDFAAEAPPAINSPGLKP